MDLKVNKEMNDNDNNLLTQEEQQYDQENKNNKTADELQDSIKNQRNIVNLNEKSNEIEVSEVSDYNKNRKWYQNYFSKVEPGSIRASIFSLSILSIGTGCLSLPQRFGQLSVLLCSIFVLLAGFASYWTLNLLIYASNKSNETTFSKVINKICGSGWGKFLDIVLVIYIFGVLIIYQIIIFEMIGAFVYEVGNFPQYKTMKSFYTDSFWGEIWFKFTLMFGTAGVFLLPLNLLKDVTKLRFTSIFGIFCLLLVTLIIIVELPQYISHYWKYTYQPWEPSTFLNWVDVSKAFTSELYFFKGAATLFYAYNCHIGLYPVYEKLIDNNKRRTKKVIARSIILDASFYLVVGVTGYLTAPINTPAVIIEREKIGNDIVMTLGRILIVILLLAKIPANYNALRISVFQLIWGTVEISTTRNLIVTVLITFGSAAIGAVYSDVSEFISLLGGFCSVIIGFFFPGFLYIKSNNRPLSDWKNIRTIIFISILCVIGIISGCLSLKSMISSIWK